MTATQRPPSPSEPAPDALGDAGVPPIPDEDGPHDVPDDEVIDKTLPTTPVPGPGG